MLYAAVENQDLLTLFRMGLFGAAHGWGGAFWPPKIGHTYPSIMKLGIVIPYPEKIQKLFELCDRHLAFS